MRLRVAWRPLLLFGFCFLAKRGAGKGVATRRERDGDRGQQPWALQVTVLPGGSRGHPSPGPDLTSFPGPVEVLFPGSQAPSQPLPSPGLTVSLTCDLSTRRSRQEDRKVQLPEKLSKASTFFKYIF